MLNLIKHQKETKKVTINIYDLFSSTESGSAENVNTRSFDLIAPGYSRVCIHIGRSVVRVSATGGEY